MIQSEKNLLLLLMPDRSQKLVLKTAPDPFSYPSERLDYRADLPDERKTLNLKKVGC
jgi:hypothetical protein